MWRQRALLGLLLVLTTARAQFYGEHALERVPGQLPQPLGQPPALKYAPASACAAGDACCPFNDSPADCASTASANKGCRSDSSCVPAADPCRAAANETACVGTGEFCKFDINTFTCQLDASRHTCASVSDPAMCKAAAGCKLQHVCRDTCSMCPSCLDAMRAFARMPSVLAQLEQDANNELNEFQAAAFLQGVCYAAAANIPHVTPANLKAGCAAVALDVARSPGLLSRPAALCNRLGLCQASCQVEAAGSDAKTDAVDLCSPTGLASGAVAPPALPTNASTAKEGSACLSSTDCPSGMDCDTFTESECFSKCDKATGMDKCTAAGRCVDICQRPDIKAAVEASQRRIKPCTSNAGCGAGETCRLPDFPCRMVKCNPQAISRDMDWVEFVACPSICLPLEPRMVNASFAPDGRSIVVDLNQEAAPLDALCSYVFDEETSALLGDASVCTTNGTQLTIWLAGDVRVRPGNALTLADTNMLFTSAMGAGSDAGLPTFGGLLPRIDGCGNCSASALDIKLLGPLEIAMACANDVSSALAEVDNGLANSNFPVVSADGFNYAALLPTDSLWMVKELSWAASSLANISVAAVQHVVADANTRADPWSRQVLSVPFSLLASMPEGPVSLAVNVTNVFGALSSANITFNKRNSSEAPLIELDKSLTRFLPSAGFRLMAVPLPGGCPLTPIKWRWHSDIPNVNLDDATGSSIAIPAHELLGHVQVGKAYTITVTAAYEGSSGSLSDSVTLLAVGSPLSVSLSGPSGTVALDANLTYDARGSFDPDDPENTASQLSFLWTCRNAVDLAPCFGSQADGMWSLDPAQLKDGQRYVVSVTVAKGDRSATASRTITPRSGPTPSAQVQRSCGVDVATGMPQPCPSVHNPTEPLTLVALPEAPFGPEDVLLSWWYDPIAVPGFLLDDSNTAAGISAPSLTVLPEGLPNGGLVTINVNLTTPDGKPLLVPGIDGKVPSGGPLFGMSSITVPLNRPPYCAAPSGQCLAVDKTNATFPDARFRACAVAWSDPESEPLSYEFGLVGPVSKQALPLDMRPSTCYTFSGLPAGESSLYACAIDSFGARSCQQIGVEVVSPQPALAHQDIDDQLERLAQELDRPGHPADPPSLVDAAMQMTSLLSSSAKSAADSMLQFVDGTLEDVVGAVTGLRRTINGGEPKPSGTQPADAKPEGAKPADTKPAEAADGEDDSAEARSATVSITSSRNEAGSRRSRAGALKPKVSLLVDASKAAPMPASNATAGALGNASAAAANTTTKLLRMMAGAASPRDADAMNSLLTAGEQLSASTPLTPEAGKALLDLFKTTMAANSNNQRPLTPQLSNSFANALTRGLDAATGIAQQHAPAPAQQAAAGAPKPPAHRRSLLAAVAASLSRAAGVARLMTPRRRLMLVTTNSTSGAMVLLSPDEAFDIIRDGAFRLSAAQKVELGGARVVGNAGVCVAPALLTKSGVDGFAVNYGCPGIEVPAKVELPSNYSATCGPNTSCNACEVLLRSAYYSPDSRSVPLIMAVVSKPNHLVVDEPKLATRVISGVMNVTLNYSGPGGAFCGGDSYAAVAARGDGCRARLELPLTGEFNASQAAACVQLVPDPSVPGRLKPGALEIVSAVHDAAPMRSLYAPKKASSMRAKRAVATCLVSRQGLWVVAQYDASAAARGVLASSGAGADGHDPLAGGDLAAPELIPGEFSAEDVAVDQKAAAVFTYAFALDADGVTSDPVALARFKSELSRAFLSGLAEQWSEGPDLSDALGALRLNYVIVGPVRAAGGVVADVTLLPPAGTNALQLQQLSSLAPAELISASSPLRAALLTGERSTAIHTETSRPPAKGLGGDAIIGLVIGSVGLMAALLAILVVMVRRRGTVAADTASEVCCEPDVPCLSSTGGGAPPGAAPAVAAAPKAPAPAPPKAPAPAPAAAPAALPTAPVARAPGAAPGAGAAPATMHTVTITSAASLNSATTRGNPAAHLRQNASLPHV